MYNIYQVAGKVSFPYIIERTSDNCISDTFFDNSDLLGYVTYERSAMTFSAYTLEDPLYNAHTKEHTLVATISSLETWRNELESNYPELLL